MQEDRRADRFVGRQGVVALSELKREIGADRVLFMGDDVTDESAFAALGPGDFGVHVGLGPSLVNVTVPDPSSLADLIETVVALRSGRGVQDHS